MLIAQAFKRLKTRHSLDTISEIVNTKINTSDDGTKYKMGKSNVVHEHQVLVKPAGCGIPRKKQRLSLVLFFVGILGCSPGRRTERDPRTESCQWRQEIKSMQALNSFTQPIFTRPTFSSLFAQYIFFQPTNSQIFLFCMTNFVPSKIANGILWNCDQVEVSPWAVKRQIRNNWSSRRLVGMKKNL